jgi:hypothetical protein
LRETEEAGTTKEEKTPTRPKEVPDRSTCRLVPQRALAKSPSCSSPKSCRDKPPRTRNMSPNSSCVIGSCSANPLPLPPLPLLPRRSPRATPPLPASAESEVLDFARLDEPPGGADAAPAVAVPSAAAPSLCARAWPLRKVPSPELTLARRVRRGRELAPPLLLPCLRPPAPLRSSSLSSLSRANSGRRSQEDESAVKPRGLPPLLARLLRWLPPPAALAAGIACERMAWPLTRWRKNSSSAVRVATWCEGKDRARAGGGGKHTPCCG